MTRITLKRILYCLVFVGIISMSTSAQDTTPNPIFVPLQTTATPFSATSDASSSVESPMPTPASEDTTLQDVETIDKVEHNVLARPIQLSSDKVHWVDRTYPYGGTQWGTKEVHLGVEFVNPRFTPIFASEAGTVVYAGTDADILIGPYENYYGYVVIIEHNLRSLDDRPVFTLYGHLDRVEVQTGQSVEIRERIGRIGSSGIALGAHLHYEVRVDDPFDYKMTRNPELWLQHYIDHGLIAGYVHDGDGNPIMGQRLVVRSETVNREIFTYSSDRVNIDPVWQENFTVGDLPAGEYEIVMLNSSGIVVFRDTVLVEPYKTTFIEIEMVNQVEG